MSDERFEPSLSGGCGRIDRIAIGIGYDSADLWGQVYFPD